MCAICLWSRVYRKKAFLAAQEVADFRLCLMKSPPQNRSTRESTSKKSYCRRKSRLLQHLEREKEEEEGKGERRGTKKGSCERVSSSLSHSLLGRPRLFLNCYPSNDGNKDETTASQSQPVFFLRLLTSHCQALFLFFLWAAIVPALRERETRRWSWLVTKTPRGTIHCLCRARAELEIDSLLLASWEAFRADQLTQDCDFVSIRANTWCRENKKARKTFSVSSRCHL